MRLLIFLFAQFFISQSVAAHPMCQVLLSRVKGNQVEMVARVGDFHAGYLYFRKLDDSSAVVNVVSVQKEFRGQGISKALFYAMTLKEPSVSVIEALLIFDNYFATGLANLGRDATFEECAEAVSKTPFWRGWRHFGFEKIIRCEHNAAIGALEVSLSK